MYASKDNLPFDAHYKQLFLENILPCMYFELLTYGKLASKRPLSQLTG